MGGQSAFVIAFAAVAAGAVCAVVADAWRRPSVAIGLAGAGLVAGAAVSLWAGWTIAPVAVFGVAMAGQAFSTLPGFIFALSALTVLSRLRSQPTSTDSTAAALVGLSALGAALTACVIDLTTLLLALETVAVCGYALVSLARTPRSAEAAMKYLIQGSVATGFALLGLAALVGTLGQTGSYAEIVGGLDAIGSASVTPALIGVVLLVAALSFKAGAAPFHSWAPDAYEGAREVDAAFLASAPKLGAIAALGLVVAAFAPAGGGADAPLGLLGGDVLPLVGLLGAFSVIVGSVAALKQRSYARMLGYAGVAQVGYALIALAAINTSAALILGVTYAIGTGGAFLGGAVLREVRPEWDGTVAGLAGLGPRVPLASMAVAVCMVSLAGLPPLAGFWGKFQVIGAAIYSARDVAASGMTGLAWLYGALAAVAIAGSVVSLAYYGAVLKALYLDSEPGVDEGRVRVGSAWAPAVAALSLVLIGLAPLVFGLADSVTGFLLN